jgi:hypothetical protein
MPILSYLGKLPFYDELQKANERASVAFEREQMLTRIRKEADAAWTARQFARVAELLQPVQGDLTEIESKRLAYAEKHVGPNAHTDDGEAKRQ